MKDQNLTNDYNEMMRIHAEMEEYERTHCGRSSPILQLELELLLMPYAEPMAKPYSGALSKRPIESRNNHF